MRFASTDEFWAAMCDARFYRVSHNQGLLMGDWIYCDTPPEDVPGFLASRLDEAFSQVVPKRGREETAFVSDGQEEAMARELWHTRRVAMVILALGALCAGVVHWLV